MDQIRLMASCTLIQEHFVEKKQQKMGKTTAAGLWSKPRFKSNGFYGGN